MMYNLYTLTYIYNVQEYIVRKLQKQSRCPSLRKVKNYSKTILCNVYILFKTKVGLYQWFRGFSMINGLIRYITQFL